MKNLKLGISALALTVASTVFAQTTSNPWLIGVGAHAENHKAVKSNLGESLGNFKTIFHFNSYAITPPLSKLTVARNINKYMVLDWQTSVGNVDNKRFGMDKEFFLMTGLGLQFKFNGLWNEESWFDPYLRLGVNYMRHDYSGLTFPRTTYNGQYTYAGYTSTTPNSQRRKDHLTIAGGIGSNFWLTKSFGLGVQGDFVGTPVDKSTVADFFQMSASILFRFGNQDRDKDGILDKDDRCPDTPGLAEFKGCPDTDGDGIPDIDDACPDVAGPVENNGCPWPDTDKDGVLDKDDNCPTVYGPVENKGCPWPKKATDVAVTEVLRDILFDFNKASINTQSNSKLDQAATIIKEASNENFVIIGATDKKGSDLYNLNLSRHRAAAVVAALALSACGKKDEAAVEAAPAVEAVASEVAPAAEAAVAEVAATTEAAASEVAAATEAAASEVAPAAEAVASAAEAVAK